MSRLSNALRYISHLRSHQQNWSRACSTTVNNLHLNNTQQQHDHQRSPHQTASTTLMTPTSTPTATPPPRHAVDNASFNDYTMIDLMRARVHMGHRTKLWHPKMAPYLLGHRNGMHIIDLDKTVTLLRRALTATSLMAEHDCTFLWLGPRDVQKSKIIERCAKRAGAFTIDGATWIGGTLTNPINSKQAKRFNYRIPDCLFVIDTNRHKPALKEAKLVGIPTIGIVDSDCDPSLVTYPIPGNDDNALAIYLYCSLMQFATIDGRKRGRKFNRPSFKVPDLPESRRNTRHSSPNRSILNFIS